MVGLFCENCITSLKSNESIYTNTKLSYLDQFAWSKAKDNDLRIKKNVGNCIKSDFLWIIISDLFSSSDYDEN